MTSIDAPQFMGAASIVAPASTSPQLFRRLMRSLVATRALSSARLMLVWVLGAQPIRRARLERSFFAIQLYLGGDWLGQYALAHWHASLPQVRIYQVISTVVSCLTFALLRTGWSERLSDPSLTIYQIVIAQALAAYCYVIFPPVQGALLVLQIVVLSFALFSLRSRGQIVVGVFPLVLMGCVMSIASRVAPVDFPPSIEFVNFVILAAVLLPVTVLGNQFTRMRLKLKHQTHELETALLRIKELAGRDELTGLHNRRFILDLIRHHVQLNARSGHNFCLGMLDIDHFKAVNDLHGHQNGDHVLRLFAQRARTTLRQTDVIARWGGEEFLILLSNSQIPHALTAIERIRTNLATCDVLAEAPAYRIRFSAGATQFVAGESIEAAIDRADQALYLAKQRGRHRTEFT